MFLFIQKRRHEFTQQLSLNTSHVLIYPVSMEEPFTCIAMFKYISCSYLSLKWTKTKVYMIGFKYISCSYLS